MAKHTRLFEPGNPAGEVTQYPRKHTTKPPYRNADSDDRPTTEKPYVSPFDKKAPPHKGGDDWAERCKAGTHNKRGRY